MSETSTFAQRIRAARPRDDVVLSLTLRVYPSGVRAFTLASMVRGCWRYATIGGAVTMTVPEARREARQLIASYTEPEFRHTGPRSPGHPMASFAEEFLDRQAPRWKPKTRRTNARIIQKNILPSVGGMTVDAVTVEHIRDWFASMSARPGIANRAMPVLSMMMKMAELRGYRAHNSNPCRNTRRYRMKQMERYPTAEEMARLNAVLTRHEFRLLMLTGCRFSEIAALEWDWTRGKRIHLPDSKSGPRTVWLSSAARSVIDAIPRYDEDCPYLFPGRPPTQPVANIANQWKRIRDDAELAGLRLHDLRHTFASRALALGEGLPMIGKLLGHTQVQTTARYAHLARDTVKASTARSGDSIEQDLHVSEVAPPGGWPSPTITPAGHYNFCRQCPVLLIPRIVLMED